MIVVARATKKTNKVKVELVTAKDYSKITKSKFFFDWKTEKENEVYKVTIQGNDEILGLVSLIEHNDKRIEISLLAVSKENRGKKKQYVGIAGNLIAWACREAVKRWDEDACVSLVPKTELIKHYKSEYGMLEAGKSLFLSDEPLLLIIERFEP